MTLPPVLATTWVVIEYLIKIAALGTVPENRRPSSSTAWLLLIFLLPLVGLPLYLLIGSPWVHGTRRRQQHTVNEITLDYTRSMPDLPKGARPSTYLAGALRMNRRLTGLPCVSGEVVAVHADPRSTYEAMARAIDAATDHVHVEFYIMSWDEVTDVFFTSLERAVARGVTVRLLLDHLGSRKYPGWKQFCQRMTDAGIHWRLMMPLLPLKRRWRRPDLRNHRKILVIDGEKGFIGSHNVIDPSYRTRRNVRAGRRWEDLSVEVTGEIVLEAQAIFAMDWFFEAGEQLEAFDLALGTPLETLPEMAGLPGILVGTPAPRPGRPDAVVNAMQLIPSGPGYPTEPNLRMFLALIQNATERVSITSPYFVPAGGDDVGCLPGGGGRAVRGQGVRPVHRQPRPALLLLGAPGGGGADLPLSVANRPALEVHDGRRRGRGHRVLQHGLPLLRPQLRGHAAGLRRGPRRPAAQQRRRLPGDLHRADPRAVGHRALVQPLRGQRLPPHVRRAVAGEGRGSPEEAGREK